MPEMNATLAQGVTDVLRGYGAQLLAVDEQESVCVVVVPGRGERTYLLTARERLTPATATALELPAGPPPLLVSSHVSEAAAAVLRARRIDFVDLAGNARLAWAGVLVDVRGRRPAPTSVRPRTPAASRAFTRSGVQVVFVLLSWPSIAARPLREIARASGVSLGTAQVVLEELMAAGYVVETGAGRSVAKGAELLGRWAEAYATWLAPRLHLAAYAVDDSRWWYGAGTELAAARVQLGGELAARLLDRHARPATATLYVDEVPAAVVVRHGMQLDEAAGTVLVRRRFWHVPDDESPLVPTVLVYADLAASGDPRQREHADRLRAEHEDLARLARS